MVQSRGKEGHKLHSLETEKDERYGVEEPGKSHCLYILEPGSRKSRTRKPTGL